jgi:myo-inositol-1(or 4)-monophosphatase
MDEFLKFAIQLSLKAGDIIKNNFTLGMAKEWKKDDTPVTVTDKFINQLVLDTIQKKYPNHSVLAEEGSRPSPQSEYVWVCDPLDGTIAFSHGLPTFVFSLALTKDGESLLGVIYDPMLNRLVIAEKGKGAFIDDKKIRVSQDANLSNETMVNLDCDYKLFGLRKKLIKEKNCYVSNLYSAVYGGLLVAVGEFVAEVYEYKKPWDGAAVKIIVEEAGGKVTNILGNEQKYNQPINGFVASNGILHEQMVNLIKQVLEVK